MGFLDLFRRRRDPAPVEQRAEWGSSAIPGPTEGAPGTYASTLAELRTAESSLQAVAVWSACDLIASVASQLPLDTYQRTSERPKQIPNGKLVEDPGGEGQGAQDWIYQYLMSKLLRGNTYGRQLSPDSRTGYPTQILLYHPDCVQGWRDRIDGQVRWYVEGRQVTDYKLWHRRSYPMPGVLLGMSPVGQHAVTIGQGMAAARFGLQFFTDGGVPGGILRNTETTVDQTLAAKVKAKWMAVMHGSREPAVLGKGWEWQGVSVNPEESQFLETQKYTSAQCARIFGPNVAEILGYETGGSMTYNTMVDRDMSFLKYTLNRWLVDLETTVFTPNLPKPQFVKFNRAALLSMDLLSRYRSYQLGIAAHILTPDEAREYEDRPPLTEEQKRELIELNVKAPSPGGEDSNPSTARASDAGPKEHRAQPGDDEDLDDAGPLDADSMALLAAIAELADEWAERAFDPIKHPRNPKGSPGGGRFRSMVDRLKDAIEAHVKDGKDGHPFDTFDREQLRRVAKARGISLKRGEDRDSIAAKLLDHIKGGGKDDGNAGETPPPKPAAKAKKKPAVEPAEPRLVELRAETHAAVADAVRALPDNDDGWRDIVQERRSATARIANKLSAAQRTHADAVQNREANRDVWVQLAGRRNPKVTSWETLKRYEPDLAAEWERHEGAAHNRYVQEAKKDLDAVQAAVDSANKQIEDLGGLKPDGSLPDGFKAPAGFFAADFEQVATWSRLTYPKDAAGVELPPPELVRMHEAVQRAGEAVHADIKTAIGNDPEIKRLIKARAAAVDESLRASPADRFAADARVREANRKIKARERELVKDGLDQLRPMGGQKLTNAKAMSAADLANYPGSAQLAPARGDWQDQLDETAAHLPDEWVRRANGSPLEVAMTDRAFHQDYGRDWRRPGGTMLMAMDAETGSSYYLGAFSSKASEVTYHETGHNMEANVPGLKALEFAYVRSKTTHNGQVEPTVKLKDLSNGGYRDDEVTYKDEFPNGYTGKTYENGDPANSPWEAFQVGLQQVFGRDEYGRYGDETLEHFVLGTMATLGRY